MTGFSQIARYLKTKLRPDLLCAYKELEILSERDLQSLVLRKLNDFFDSVPELRQKYYATAERHSKRLDVYPDITIVRKLPRGDKARICIELKEAHTWGRSALHDWQKLCRIREKLDIRHGYLIFLARAGNERDFPRPPRNSPRCLFPICIALQQHMDEIQFQEWRNQRRMKRAALRVRVAKGSSTKSAAKAKNTAAKAKEPTDRKAKAAAAI